MSYELKLVPGTYSVLRFPLETVIPAEVWSSRFVSVTQTEDELSVVVEEGIARSVFGPSRSPKSTSDTEQEVGFCAFRVVGTLAFELTGVLHALTKPLAEKRISVFAVSTYDTDYLLVKRELLEQCQVAFEAAGFLVHREPV